jgi:threonine/homoserine/homoserine lactone efflux protein
MDWSLFPRGAIIGLSVAAPVGPMAVLCIRRTLARGRATGLLSGFGIAAADATYGAIAAFGLSSISSFLVDLQDVVRLVGGAFLLWLGWRTLRSRAADISQSGETGKINGIGAFLSTLGLTLTNPTTILSFVAIFSGIGFVSDEVGTASAVALVSGVFLGSTLWWVVLISLTAFLRGKLTVRRLTLINQFSGLVILTFGGIALLSAIR